MKIYLVRHGESEGNKRRLLYGWTDLPLTELGKEQAREVGAKLKGLGIARCYASPLVRAAETARLCTEGLDVEIEWMDGLREQHMGEFEDVPFEPLLRDNPELVRKMFADWTKNAPPGGESFEEVSERANKCLDKIIERGEDALIVAHNGSLSTLLARLLDAGVGTVTKLLFEQGCYACVEMGERMTRLVCFNR